MSRISDAIIAHYRMNDNLATDVILDATGSHNGAVKDAGGTATSAAHSVNGHIAKAQGLDGDDDHIEVPDHADFTPALTPFSISAWVWMDDATHFHIVSKGQQNVDGEWWFWVNSFDYPSLRLFDESVLNCSIGTAYETAITGSEGKWIQLVATYDGGILSAGCKLYMNGRLLASVDKEQDAASFVSVENLAHAVYMGRLTTNYTDGKVDNVMIFNIELTADDVARSHNAGRGTELHCEMDEGRTRERGLRRAG